MTPLAWVAALLVAGLAALVLEVFVPSGGVLGFLSVLALVAGIVLAFVEQGPWFGMAVLAVTCVAVPVALGLAFRIFPETPLGRRVMPPPPRPEEVVPDAARRDLFRGLVGRAGLATSDLVPWGVVAIDGVDHQAVSDGGPLACGTPVEVVGAQPQGLVVRRASPAAPSPPQPAPDVALDGAPTATPSAVPRDLEAALEAFDFEALERPPQTRSTAKLDAAETPNDP